MPSSHFAIGIRAGLVAAAATAGAVAGFGLRRGDWSNAFVTLATNTVVGVAGSDLPRTVVLLAGLGVHVAIMVTWGLLFAALSRRRALPGTIGIAILVTLAAALAAAPLVPAAVGAIRLGGLTVPHVWLSLALMSAGFVTGRALSPA